MSQHEDQHQADSHYDLLVIGGGVNGCGIARDAAGRGLKVLLCEQGDLAGATSSASTKLIHGGLRYLEYYEFGLVRKALSEREVLLNNAPHIIWPLRFVLPHHKELRPAWLLRLGLFLYDHLGGRKLLPATRTVNLQQGELGGPLREGFLKGFEYSDCWVDDARLVVLNALDASRRGATILTRTCFSSASREADQWRIRLQDVPSQQHREVTARAIVNAAGPWVDEVLASFDGAAPQQKHIRPVRGSHIIVPRLYDHDRAYIFQNADQRIIFAIPYEAEFTLIGTTDADHDDRLDVVTIDAAETRYLCEAASVYFKRPISADEIVWSYSGVRSLYDDGADEAQAATRDYVLDVAGQPGEPGLLSVFGGKITTYRTLAEAAMEKLEAFFEPSIGSAWTADAALPGGDFALAELDEQVSRLQQDYDFIDEAWAHSLIRRYGTRAWDCLGDARERADLGMDFGATLSEREVRFLIQEEWARSSEDILWRRSKLGLHMSQSQIDTLQQWLDSMADEPSVA